MTKRPLRTPRCISHILSKTQQISETVWLAVISLFKSSFHKRNSYLKKQTLFLLQNNDKLDIIRIMYIESKLNWKSKFNSLHKLFSLPALAWLRWISNFRPMTKWVKLRLQSHYEYDCLDWFFNTFWELELSKFSSRYNKHGVQASKRSWPFIKLSPNLGAGGILTPPPFLIFL